VRLRKISLAHARCATGDNDAVPACALRFIESLVGEFEQQIEAIGSLIECGNAD
jgi:hypothetical protein